MHKDVARAQDIIVKELFNVFDRAVLHGSTAIWRCYNGNRFSEDIDVYIPKDEKGINNFFNNLEKDGFIINKRKITEDSIFSRLELNRTIVRFEALFKKPLPKGSLGEYEASDGNLITVYTLTPEEIIEEKVEAYLKRFMIRDLYDIFFLLRCVKDKGSISKELKRLVKGFKRPFDEKELKVLIIEGLIPDVEKMLEYIRRAWKMGKEKYFKGIMNLFKNSPVVDAKSIARIIKSKKHVRQYNKQFIRNLLLKGKVKKLAKGCYTVHDDLSLAVFCFNPAYLGLQDALSFHNLYEQETILVIVTTRKVRQGIRRILDTNVLIRRINKRYFFGFDYEKQGNFFIPYSDIEKSFIDMVHFKERLSKGLLNEIKGRIDKKKLNSYLKVYPKRIRKKVLEMIKQWKLFLDNFFTSKLTTKVKWNYFQMTT